MRLGKCWLLVCLLAAQFSGMQRGFAEVEGKLKVPTVEKLFSAHLPEVKEAVDMEKLAPLAMLVSTADAEAAKLTWAGFSYLHAGWDLEAYRYFCQALRLDEACLMAHAGIALSLGSPSNNERLPQRHAAVIRMLELVEQKVDGEYFFPEKERGFAIAVGYLLSEGREVGAEVFGQLAKKYPKDLQIPLMAAVFNRAGYDSLGKARMGEQKALAAVKKIYRDNPAHPLAAQYLLVLYLDAPISAEKLREVALPAARKLAANKDVATWQHWLGVFEYRCGNLGEAEKAFSRSVKILSEWKEKNKIQDADADALWKSYLFLSMVLFERGDVAGAEKIAKMFRVKTVDEKRLWAVGTQLILWDGYSLGTRMHLSEKKGDIALAQSLLPKKKVLMKLKGKSAALYYYEFLAIYLGMRKAEEKGDYDAVDKLRAQLAISEVGLGEAYMTTLKSGESHSGIRFVTHMRALAMLSRYVGEDSDAMKVVELDGAISKRRLPKRMLPPLFFHPLDLRLAKVYEKQKKHDESQKLLTKALMLRPSHPKLWEYFLKTAKKTKDEEAQKLAQKRLKELKN